MFSSFWTASGSNRPNTKIAISCKTIDRIVNDIYERYHERDDDAIMQSEMRQGEITMPF